MKRVLSTVTFLMLLAVVSLTAQCCSANASSKSSSTASEATANISDVKVYYFHFTRRCVTCQSVEKVAQEALAEKFGDAVPFQSVNVEDENAKSLLEKYKVSGQALLVVKGDKVENLTNFAFMNARTNPDKLKNKIAETVKSL